VLDVTAGDSFFFPLTVTPQRSHGQRIRKKKEVDQQQGRVKEKEKEFLSFSLHLPVDPHPRAAPLAPNKCLSLFLWMLEPV